MSFAGDYNTQDWERIEAHLAEMNDTGVDGTYETEPDADDIAGLNFTDRPQPGPAAHDCMSLWTHGECRCNHNTAAAAS